VHETIAFRCKCCGLSQVSTYSDDGAAVRSCVRCRHHSDETIEDLAAREADHAAMYHHALIDAQDETLLAQGERDHYRDKMQAAYGSRELLVQVLSQIEHLHHLRGKRCACGRRGCRVADLIADPRVTRLIRNYDEVQRTMRELREANPGRWVEKWDYIDVSLVYPGARRPSSRGRHRAAG
jgi:Zn ribbon nucleic-acid-binding protein